jgi:hypothetical protein
MQPRIKASRLHLLNLPKQARYGLEDEQRKAGIEWKFVAF